MSLADTLRERPAEIASIIEHTNVDPDPTETTVRELCETVVEYGFCSAVVVPYHAELAHDIVGDSAKVTAVVGFPYGIQNTAAKQTEARALLDYADEIDMVMNRTAFANGDDDAVVSDIAAVRETVGDTTLKVIIESPALSPAEIERAAALVEEGGADFVKTAVGYDGPTDPGDVEAIRRAVGPEMGIKASGGIGSFEAALAMVRAGATRIGASSGVAIYESATSPA
jgi:deoxyribose-phosphate aldolase